jgi:hypothetical protein
MAIIPDFDSRAGWRQGGVDPGVVQMLSLHPLKFLLLVPDQRIIIRKKDLLKKSSLTFWAPCALHSCTHWLRFRTPPPAAFGFIYEGAIGQARRRHLFGTP